MLRGDKISLRARIEMDVPILHAELYDDVAIWSRASSRPWKPVGSAAASPYAVVDPTEDIAEFSVITRADAELAGTALLCGIDLHNRIAHIGVFLRPGLRGRGFGSDVVRVLCRYGFDVRGLHRLQIETLADNDGMLRAASKSGFVEEGKLRRSAWVNGRFTDEVILGLLASDWRSN